MQVADCGVQTLAAVADCGVQTLEAALLELPTNHANKEAVGKIGAAAVCCSEICVAGV